MTRGFTLIELLIAITILVIVSTIGFASYSNAQIAGRDFRRKDDLRHIQTALELYKQKNGRYPCTASATNGGWVSSDSSSTPWLQESASDTACTSAAINLDTNYINILPRDPLNTGGPTNPANYGYAYGWGAINIGGAGNCPVTMNGNYYILIARLENTADVDSNKTRRYAYCDSSTDYIFSTNPADDNGFAITSQ